MTGIRLGYATRKQTQPGQYSFSEVLRYKGGAHLLTVAPTRSGKGRDVLVPALLEYEGSCIVIDPKGQLAAVTRAQRERMGQRVMVLNPFNLLPDELGTSAKYNPMGSLDPDADSFGADCDSLADAIVTRETHGDNHFPDSARQLVSGVIMQLATAGREEQKNLSWVRKLISGPTSVLQAFVSNALQSDEGGFVAERLARFENVTEESRELLSIISTANTQTGFISNKAIRENLSGSDFRFRELKRTAMTVYLVLPAKYLDTCGKWFRLVVASALADLWSEEKGRVPVLAILDEFAQLGRLQAIQNAMGLAAGYGLQLWPILQDLTQLKDLYNDRWETFLANAGIQQFFAPRENTTAEYVSMLCGETTVTTRSQSTSTSTSSPSVGGGGGKTESTSTSTSETQRRFRLAQEVRGLSDAQFLMFAEGVTHVIEGFRQPYYKTSEFNGLYSPDPYHKSDAQPQEEYFCFLGINEPMPGINVLDPSATPIAFNPADWDFRFERNKGYVLGVFKYRKLGVVILVWNRATWLMVEDPKARVGHFHFKELDQGIRRQLSNLDPYYDVIAEPRFGHEEGWRGRLLKRLIKTRLLVREHFGMKPTLPELGQMALLVHNQAVGIWPPKARTGPAADEEPGSKFKDIFGQFFRDADTRAAERAAADAAHQAEMANLTAKLREGSATAEELARAAELLKVQNDALDKYKNLRAESTMAPPAACPECNGTGDGERIMAGTMTFHFKCVACGGTGHSFKDTFNLPQEPPQEEAGRATA